MFRARITIVYCWMFEMKDATDFPPLASVNVIQAVHDGVKI